MTISLMYKAMALGGATGSIPLSYIGYSAWNNSGLKGSEWLDLQQHEYNPPQFTDHENMSHGCSDNLFKETDEVIDNEVYGCTVMMVDLYKKTKSMKFNGEVAIRKGNKGWIINSKLESKDDSYEPKHSFSKLTFSNNKWDKKTWVYDGTIVNYGKIQILMPKEAEKRIIDGNKWINTTPTDKHLQVEYSGAWIANRSSKDDIFKELKVQTIGQNSYNLFDEGGYLKINGSVFAIDNLQDNKWKTALMKKEISLVNSASANPYIAEMHREIKNMKGTWVDLNSICGLSEKRDINGEEQSQLKMFCSK